MLELRPFGSAFELRTGLGAVRDAALAGLGRYPQELGIGGDLVVEVVAHADSVDDPGWPQVHAELDRRGLVIRCGSSHAALEFAAGHARISVASSLLTIPDALRLLLESVFTSYHVDRQRLLAVHSALVSRNGVGVLLRGPSGAGKSTLTYACMERGMGMTSDDWLYAARQAPPEAFAGYPWRMLMTEDAAARFRALQGVAPVPHTSVEGCKIPVAPPPDQQVPLQAVNAVVLLDPAGPLSLQPVGPDEARQRFWDAALPTEREHLPSPWVEQLLARPVYVLRRGSSPVEAAALLDDLAASLR